MIEEMSKEARELAATVAIVFGMVAGVFLFVAMIVAVSWIRHHAETPCTDEICPCHAGSEQGDD